MRVLWLIFSRILFFTKNEKKSKKFQRNKKKKIEKIHLI